MPFTEHEAGSSQPLANNPVPQENVKTTYPESYGDMCAARHKREGAGRSNTSVQGSVAF